MLQKLTVVVDTLVEYGADFTNPEFARHQDRARAIRNFGLVITFIATLFFIIRYELHEQLYRQKQFCEYMRSGLGPILVNRTWLDDPREHTFPDVYWGGRYSPSHCTARHRVAIIVPYRGQRGMLPIFLKHMHQFLMKQQIEYGIFVVQQTGHDHFNRGKLLNIGFVESQKQRPGGWECFVFHDIDLLPLDTRNLYSCPQRSKPKHLAAVVENEENEKPPYDARFGGVAAMTLWQFNAVNGYSNAFWGCDDKDDMSKRLQAKGYTISRNDKSIGIYTSLKLKPTVVDRQPTVAIHQEKRYYWYKAMIRVKRILREDGLSTLKYALAGVYPRRLHTHIMAKIGKSPSREQLMRLLKKYAFWIQACHNGDQSYEQFKKERKGKEITIL